MFLIEQLFALLSEYEVVSCLLRILVEVLLFREPNLLDALGAPQRGPHLLALHLYEIITEILVSVQSARTSLLSM